MIKWILAAIAILAVIFLVLVIVSACILSGQTVDREEEEYIDYLQNKRKSKEKKK